MIVRHIIAICGAASTLLSGPVLARDWGNESGWQISSGRQSCGMYAQQRASSIMDIVFLKRLDGSIVMQLKSPGWNIAAGTEGRIQYKLDGRLYTGPASTSFMVSNTGRTLIAAFGSDFEREFRSSGALTLIFDGRTLDQVSLSGSASAMSIVQMCLDELRSGTVSASAGFASLAAKAPIPKNSAASWITIEDYPDSAQRERSEGTASFRISVGKDGRVENCIITKSSGHKDLDTATCNNVLRRAKFAPALDANGNPVAATYESRVTWKLPK